MGYEICKFGTLCLDNKDGTINTYPVPQKPGTKGNICGYNGKSIITIIDTGQWPTHTITWIKPDGLPIFIADRPLLVNISWNELEANGFVQGKELWIDGFPYRCRLVQVGPFMETNEWDMALEATESSKQSNKLWHTDGVFFWGSVPGVDLVCDGDEVRFIRGNLSPRTFQSMPANHKAADVGFRPVLEPIPIRSLDPQKYIQLDGFRFLITQIGSKGVEDDFNLSGGYPILNPRNAETISMLGNIPNGAGYRMYTLLKDGKPVNMQTKTTPVFPKGAVCTLTDKFFGEKYLIPWNIINGVAVPQRRLFKVSTDDTLEQKGGPK